MIKKETFLKYLFVTSIILFGCKKETPQLSNEQQQQQNAINEIRKIVGNQGKIEILLKSSYDKNFTNINGESIIDKAIAVRYLSLLEFKDLYGELDNFNYQKIIAQDSSSQIKTMDLDDNPGRPGLHRIKYYAFPYSIVNGTYGINTSTSQFTVLNLWYETNKQGRVIGTPIIFYSGVTFVQNWTQLYVTDIQYNSVNNTSTFTIAGSTLYGISIFGQNIGWTGKGGV